jgi:ketosteroid isomerase-like protein
MVHHLGRGKASGIDIDQRFAMVWTLKDRRAVRMDMYPTRDEALEAVGASTRENVERVRAGYDAWSRGDLEAFLALLDEDIEFRTAGVFPGLDPVYRGHAGIKKFWGDFRDPWQSLRIVIDHFRERGDQLVALYRFEAVGREGVSVHRQAANVITVRNGLAIRIEAFESWKAALDAAGM